MIVKAGSTDVTTYFTLRLAATGVEATALDVTTFDLQYVRSRVAPVAKQDATALAATDSAHADNKAIEIDATDQPGLYRVDWPDAAFAVAVREVILTVKCATCFTEHLRVELSPMVDAQAIDGDEQTAADLKDFADTGYDPATHKVAGVVLVDLATATTTITTYTGNTLQTANGATAFTRVLLALPAAAPDGAGGLPISDAGGLDLDALPGSPAAALVAVNLDHLVGTATGIPALPAGTYLDARTLAAAGYFDPTTDTVLLGNGAHGGAAATFQFVSGSSGIITGSLSGSVGSVAGNVTGSVGSVAGNVTGSVGSVAGNVTGSVGSVAGNVTGSVGSLTGFNTTGTGLTAIPWNAAWDAEVQSECNDALVAYSASTYAGGPVASVTGAVGSVAGLNAALLDVAVSTRLATVGYTAPPAMITTGAIVTAMEAAGTILNHLGTALVVDGAVWQFTANALELAPTGGTATFYEED